MIDAFDVWSLAELQGFLRELQKARFSGALMVEHWDRKLHRIPTWRRSHRERTARAHLENITYRELRAAQR
jgi:hypothetical protein